MGVWQPGGSAPLTTARSALPYACLLPNPACRLRPRACLIFRARTSGAGRQAVVCCLANGLGGKPGRVPAPVPTLSNQGSIGSCAGDRRQLRRETGETSICHIRVELVPRPDG